MQKCLTTFSLFPLQEKFPSRSLSLLPSAFTHCSIQSEAFEVRYWESCLIETHCVRTNSQEPRLVLWHTGKLSSPWGREVRWNWKTRCGSFGGRQRACSLSTGTVKVFVTPEKSWPKRETPIIWNNPLFPPSLGLISVSFGVEAFLWFWNLCQTTSSLGRTCQLSETDGLVTFTATSRTNGQWCQFPWAAAGACHQRGLWRVPPAD